MHNNVQELDTKEIALGYFEMIGKLRDTEKTHKEEISELKKVMGDEIRQLKIIVTASILEKKRIGISLKRLARAERLVDKGKISIVHDPENYVSGIKIGRMFNGR